MAGNNRGIALILVLWIMLALVLLSAGVGMLARTESHIARNHADRQRCRWAARAGVYRAIADVKTLAGERATYLGEEPYTLSSNDLQMNLDGCSFEAAIEDEGGRININTASNETLANLFGNSEIADCIVDWRDINDIPGPLGAESVYYSSLSMPYRCKNADFDTVDELMLVKGITRDMLYTVSGESGCSLADVITVYAPADASRPSGSSQLIDIQNDSRQRLRSTLGDVLSNLEIDAIVNYRSRMPLRSVAQIVRVPGLPRAKVARIYDRLTIRGAPVQAGATNINTAPAAVLEILPGMDSNIAQAIIDYRVASGPFESVGSLLYINSITNNTFVSIAPYLTVKSAVFRVTSTGRIEKTGASAAITAVLEVINGQARIRYWQE